MRCPEDRDYFFRKPFVFSGRRRRRPLRICVPTVCPQKPFVTRTPSTTPWSPFLPEEGLDYTSPLYPKRTPIFVGGDVPDAPFKTIISNLTFARQGNAATKPPSDADASLTALRWIFAKQKDGRSLRHKRLSLTLPHRFFAAAILRSDGENIRNYRFFAQKRIVI